MNKYILLGTIIFIAAGIFLLFQLGVLDKNKATSEGVSENSTTSTALIDLVPLYGLSLAEINERYSESELLNDRLTFNFGSDSVVITSSEKYGFTSWIRIQDTTECTNPQTLTENLARFGIDINKLGKKTGKTMGSNVNSNNATYCDSDQYPFGIEYICSDDKKNIVLGDKETCRKNTASTKDQVVESIIDAI